MTDNRATILIVDDNIDSQQILTKILTSAGYQTVICADGQEAMKSIEANPPALVLLDLMMPRVSGFEVVTRLQSSEKTRHIPVIVMSAYLNGSEAMRNMKGIARVLPKAEFRTMTLLATVAEILGSGQTA
jgi:CheY-like chemotaxis protein